MKNHIPIVGTALALLIAAAIVPASSYAMTGREIMEKYSDHFKVADETDKATMTLINKQGKKRVRSLTIMTKEYPGDLNKILIRFTAPERIYGAGLLISEQQNRSDDQWLYLPALKKVKKVSTTERSHSFMGSEFSYEDLHGEKLKDFTYKLLGSENLNGQDCYIVEAIPTSQRKLSETGYGKRKIWLRKDIFFKVKVEYYDKNVRLLKTETDEALTPIGGGKYRMNRVIMLNNQTGKKTVLDSKSRTIETGIPSSKFTTTFLERSA